MLLSQLSLLDPLWRRGMQSRAGSGNKYSRPDNSGPPGKGVGCRLYPEIEGAQEDEEEASKLKRGAVLGDVKD